MPKTIAPEREPEVREHLSRVLAAIESYRGYENDYDPDGPQVTEETIAAAKSLVCLVQAEFERHGLRGMAPGLSMDSDARIHLSWGRTDPGAHAIVKGGPNDLVILILHEPGRDPQRSEVRANEAVHSILTLMSGRA